MQKALDSRFVLVENRTRAVSSLYILAWGLTKAQKADVSHGALFRGYPYTCVSISAEVAVSSGVILSLVFVFFVIQILFFFVIDILFFFVIEIFFFFLTEILLKIIPDSMNTYICTVVFNLSSYFLQMPMITWKIYK